MSTEIQRQSLPGWCKAILVIDIIWLVLTSTMFMQVATGRWQKNLELNFRAESHQAAYANLGVKALMVVVGIVAGALLLNRKRAGVSLGLASVALAAISIVLGLWTASFDAVGFDIAVQLSVISVIWNALYLFVITRTERIVTPAGLDRRLTTRFSVPTLIVLAILLCFSFVFFKFIRENQVVVPPTATKNLKHDAIKRPTPVATIERNTPQHISEPSATGKRVKSIPSAVNFVTNELATAIELSKKVLLVWVFDQSASAQDEKCEVAGLLDSMYRRLNGAARQGNNLDQATEPGDDALLRSAVVAFGPTVNVLTKTPIADSAEVMAVIEGIATTSSPLENTFAAIQKTADILAPHFEQTLVVFVVVSDEVGDDETMVDDLLLSLNERRIRVHVVGRAAAFGSIQGIPTGLEIPTAAGQIAVRQGPESRELEWIRLDYASGSDRHNVPNINVEMGPYSLQRLCNGTGGIYFAIPTPNLREWRDEDGKMQRYAPAYTSHAEYRKRVISNKAYKALLEAAKSPRVEVVDIKGVVLNKSDDEAKRLRELNDAMQPVLRSEKDIRNLYERLKEGAFDSSELTEPRLRAAFDLALGRSMAAMARVEGFLTMCSVMRAGRDPKVPETQSWVLEPGDFPVHIGAMDQMAKNAKDLLRRVIDEHPNTPWAESAQRELVTPMGYRWVER